MTKDIPQPICPLNLYFEGDEDLCNPKTCDYDPEIRMCTMGCKGEM